MERTDFTPGMQVRCWTRDQTPREVIGEGVVATPEPLPSDQLQTTGMVLVWMEAHDGHKAMNWWFNPEQLEIRAC